MKASSSAKVQQLLDDSQPETGAAAAASKTTFSKAVSIEDAVDQLVVAYSIAQRWDVSGFAEDYARRPVATLEDIFGSLDLSYDEVTETRTEYKRVVRVSKEGLSKAAAAAGELSVLFATGARNSLLRAASHLLSASRNLLVYKRIKIQRQVRYWKKTTGKEGFFSRALVDTDDPLKLLDPDTKLAIEKRGLADAFRKLDTRKQKRQAVVDYVSDVTSALTTGEA